MATRLRDSPTLSDRPSAKASTCRAAGTPGHPFARRVAASSCARQAAMSASDLPALRRAASATATAASNDMRRATSTTVRATDVAAIPSTMTTSSPCRGAVWTCTRASSRPPEGRSNVTCARSSGMPQVGRPCSTAAETWLATAPATELGERRLKEERMAGGAVVGCALPLHVGAAPDRDENAASHQAAHVVFAVARRPQVGGAVQYRFHTAERAAHDRAPTGRQPVPVDNSARCGQPASRPPARRRWARTQEAGPAHRS